MPRPKFIYAMSMFSYFYFQPRFHHNQSYNLIKTDILVFAHILEYLLLSLDDNFDEESEQFSDSKSSVSGCCSTFA